MFKLTNPSYEFFSGRIKCPPFSFSIRLTDNLLGKVAICWAMMFKARTRHREPAYDEDIFNEVIKIPPPSLAGDLQNDTTLV